MNIGSRPARRRQDASIASLRAIPWVFAWMQTRLLLPAWLGVGEALSSGLEQGHRETVLEMAQKWPFFRTTLDLVEMVLAKAAPWVLRHYESVLVPAAQHARGASLCERYERTRQLLLEAVGRKALLDTNPVLKRSIQVRNPYVDPINLVQVEILRRMRTEAGPAEADAELRARLQDAFAVTVNGVAAGMRNTG